MHAILRTKLIKTSGELLTRTEPAGATVLLSGRDVDDTARTPFRRWLPAGEYRARLTKDGFIAQDLELAVGIGETIEREVKLQSREEMERLAAEAAAAEEAKRAKEEEAVKQAKVEAAKAQELKAARQAKAEADKLESGRIGWPFWASFGAGAVLLAGAATYGVLAKDADEELDAMKDDPSRWKDVKEQHGKAESRALVSNVLYGLGGAAAVTGLVIWGAF